MKARTSLAMLAAAVLFLAAPAYADTIYFSGQASDNDVPVGVFDGEIVYSFDALANVFTMTIVNQTVAPDAYRISVAVFNTSSDVTGLTLTGNGGFTGATLGAIERGDGFGWFDWGLDLGPGNTGVAAGNSATFTFAVTGSNLDITDFFSGLSWGGGLTPAVAAMHFAAGPNGDSAWTIPTDKIVPEPATMALLGLGIAGMVVTRKRFS